MGCPGVCRTCLSHTTVGQVLPTDPQTPPGVPPIARGNLCPMDLSFGSTQSHVHRQAIPRVPEHEAPSLPRDRGRPTTSCSPPSPSLRTPWLGTGARSGGVALPPLPACTSPAGPLRSPASVSCPCDMSITPVCPSPASPANWEPPLLVTQGTTPAWPQEGGEWDRHMPSSSNISQKSLTPLGGAQASYRLLMWLERNHFHLFPRPFVVFS